MHDPGKPSAHCCYLSGDGQGCEEPAEWRIRHGDELDEYTESCTAHVGLLLTDAPEHRIYPWSAPLLKGTRRRERAQFRRILATTN